MFRISTLYYCWDLLAFRGSYLLPCLVEKKEFFIDICQNCWGLNFRLVKQYLLSKTLGYYYRSTIKYVHCVLLSDILKFWNFNLKLPNIIFYIYIWQSSANMSCRYSSTSLWRKKWQCLTYPIIGHIWWSVVTLFY